MNCEILLLITVKNHHTHPAFCFLVNLYTVAKFKLNTGLLNRRDKVK